MDKIAVKCESQEEADEVRSKTGKSLNGNGDWSKDRPYYDSRLKGSGGITYNGFHLKMFFKNEDFEKFISASEFLGKEEPMFKVGDEVRAKPDCNNDFKGGEGIIEEFDNEGMVIRITKQAYHNKYSPGTVTSKLTWQTDIELVKPSKATKSETFKKEEEMNTLLSKVLKDSKLADAELVDKHKAVIIGSMEDTLVNLDTLEAIGAKKLIAMAKNLRDAEQDKDKSE